MSQLGVLAKNILICRECGISNPADARECWLCHGTRWKLQGQGGDQSVHSRGFFSTIAGWMILIAGFGLGLALYQGSPGDRIVAIVLVVPPWLMVEARAAKLRCAGRSMSALDRVVTFLTFSTLVPLVFGGAVIIVLLVTSLRA